MTEQSLTQPNRPTNTIHEHAIILLQSTFAPISDRFLLVEDPRWRCPLFLHYKASAGKDSFLIQRMSGDLLIPEEAIFLSYLSQAVHMKYSVSAGEIRTYHHRFYRADVNSLPEHLKADSFAIDGRQYRWMGLLEMERDENIQSKNGDIVGCVKALLEK